MRVASAAADASSMSRRPAPRLRLCYNPPMKASPSVKVADEELVALAKNGDLRAFEDLVERYKQKAYHIAFDFTRDREEAKDLSQEAFLRAYTKLAYFDGRSGFYTWFYRILVNMCLDYRRWKKRTAADAYDESVEARVEPSHSTAPSLDEHVIAREMSEKVGIALEALPPKQRTVFILKNHRDLSIKEIAELMHAAEGTVKVHLHRAVSALRQSLVDFIGEGHGSKKPSS